VPIELLEAHATIEHSLAVEEDPHIVGGSPMVFSSLGWNISNEIQTKVTYNNWNSRRRDSAITVS
jgi:hypothetical protein